MSVFDLLASSNFKSEVESILKDGKVELKEVVTLALNLAKTLESSELDALRQLKGSEKTVLVCKALRFLLTDGIKSNEEQLQTALAFVDTTIPYTLQAAIAVSNGFDLKTVQTVGCSLLQWFTSRKCQLGF